MGFAGAFNLSIHSLSGLFLFSFWYVVHTKAILCPYLFIFNGALPFHIFFGSDGDENLSQNVFLASTFPLNQPNAIFRFEAQGRCRDPQIFLGTLSLMNLAFQWGGNRTSYGKCLFNVSGWGPFFEFTMIFFLAEIFLCRHRNKLQNWPLRTNCFLFFFHENLAFLDTLNAVNFVFRSKLSSKIVRMNFLTFTLHNIKNWWWNMNFVLFFPSRHILCPILAPYFKMDTNVISSFIWVFGLRVKANEIWWRIEKLSWGKKMGN